MFLPWNVRYNVRNVVSYDNTGVQGYVGLRRVLYGYVALF